VPRSNICACGIRAKVHRRTKSLRGVKTDRRGNVRPGAGHRINLRPAGNGRVVSLEGEE